MSRKKNGYDFACEIRGAAAIVSGIGCTFEKGGDRPIDEYMKSALSGVTSYLERIADELDKM